MRRLDREPSAWVQYSGNSSMLSQCLLSLTEVSLSDGMDFLGDALVLLSAAVSGSNRTSVRNR